jgi:hypothetical protein
MRFSAQDYFRGRICNRIWVFQRSDPSVSAQNGLDLPKLWLRNAEKLIFSMISGSTGY